VCPLCSHASVIGVDRCHLAALSILMGSISPLMWGLQVKDAQSSIAEGLPCSSLCVFCTESLVHGGLYAGVVLLRV
jgi:hypothetical protein